MGRRRTAGACVVAALLLPAACSSEETPAPVIGRSSTAPSDTASTPAGDPEEAPSKGDKVGDSYSVTAGTLPEDPDQKAIAEVLVAYMDARVASYNSGSAVPPLAGTAMGQALTEVQARAAQLRERGWRTVGDMVIDVDGVAVEGRTAEVTACIVNTTVDVNSKGVAVETPSPAYDATATAARFGRDAWLIDTISFSPRDDC